KHGLDPVHLRHEWQRRDAIPFDAAHRFMATLDAGPDGGCWAFVKGAPEKLMAMSRTQLGSGGATEALDPDFWSAAIARAASRGERVLGFAAKRMPADASSLSFADLDDGLVLLGIVGFIDPPREEAVAAIAECRSAGIDVKMITGDHAATAAAIARQLGLADEPVVATGADLDSVSDEALIPFAKRTHVFA